MFRISDVDTHEELRRTDELEPVYRHHRILVAGFLLIAPALAVSGWYAYSVLQRHEMALQQFPGIAKFANSVGTRMKQNDLKLTSLADDQQSLHDQLAVVGQSIETRVTSITNQAHLSAVDAYHRLEAEIEERLQHVDARLTRIETSNEIQAARIAQLQRELEEVRKPTAKKADDKSTTRSDTDEDGATH